MPNSSSANQSNFDINEIATDLNNKMDRDGVNSTCPVVISRTANSNGGVTEIWSDGYCVQTGIYTGNTKTITLSQEYASTSYIVLFEKNSAPAYWATTNLVVDSKTTTTFTITKYGDSASMSIVWRAEGYIR